MSESGSCCRMFQRIRISFWCDRFRWKFMLYQWGYRDSGIGYADTYSAV